MRRRDEEWMNGNGNYTYYCCWVMSGEHMTMMMREDYIWWEGFFAYMNTYEDNVVVWWKDWLVWLIDSADHTEVACLLCCLLAAVLIILIKVESNHVGVRSYFFFLDNLLVVHAGRIQPSIPPRCAACAPLKSMAPQPPAAAIEFSP